MSKNFSVAREFMRIKQMISNLTFSFPIMLINQNMIEKIDQEKLSDSTLNSLAKELYQMFQKVKAPEDYTQMGQAFEIYSECDLYIKTKEKGTLLRRTSGTGEHKQKRPDFECVYNSDCLYFELKTLEVMCPLVRHPDTANKALEIAAEIGARAKTPGVHFAEPLEISGYNENLTSSQRIDETIKKIVQNIKKEQINYGPTVLVVNLGRLPNITFGSSSLLPVFYHSTPTAESCVSGELWQIAYGKIGEQVFKLPEFNGASNLDGHQMQEGILHQFPELIAITFMIPRLSEATELFTIWNIDSSHQQKAGLGENDIEKILYQYSDAVNDTQNKKGWKYRTYS